MARYPYRILKNAFDRVFRNDLNKNFKDIEADIKSQKNRVDNLINEVEQPSEVVDARVDADGHVYPVLKERLDTEQHNTETELLNHEDRIQQNSEDISVNAQKIYMTNQNLDNLISRIGNNEDLNTTEKASLILAINEVYAKANSNESSIADINDSISQLADMISGLGNDLTEHENKTALDDVHGLLSGGHIVEETGENENGRYVRFADGTQICTYEVQINNFATTQHGDVHRYVHTGLNFPASFIEMPQVTINARGSVNMWANAVISSSSINIYTPVIFSIISYTDGTARISVLAIGRWK